MVNTSYCKVNTYKQTHTYYEHINLGKKRRVDDEVVTVIDDDVGDDDGIPGAATKNVERNDEQIQEDEFGAKDYRLVFGESCFNDRFQLKYNIFLQKSNGFEN